MCRVGVQTFPCNHSYHLQNPALRALLMLSASTGKRGACFLGLKIFWSGLTSFLDFFERVDSPSSLKHQLFSHEKLYVQNIMKNSLIPCFSCSCSITNTCLCTSGSQIPATVIPTLRQWISDRSMTSSLRKKEAWRSCLKGAQQMPSSLSNSG